jgi:midasin (ATPase involved in ribosome maturation)
MSNAGIENSFVQDNLKSCLDFKPKELIISDLKWKYLVRAVLRGKNIMIVGPSGCAKTLAARSVATALQRPFEKFNIGSTQDARATLIGNTTYKKETGTVFHKSAFVKAITTPNTIVLLDEFTRGSHDAWNLLMTVTDPLQRCLRLDEDENSTVINVAEGVSFIATANIGNEYTATKVLDKASARRFPIKLEMSPLTGPELRNLLHILFPSRNNEQTTKMLLLTKIYEDIVAQCAMEDASITTIISPANMVEMAELVMDSFSLEEIAEAAIYPEYPDEGGADSERAFVKSILQKYFAKDAKNPINDPLKNKPTKQF